MPKKEVSVLVGAGSIGQAIAGAGWAPEESPL